MTVDLISDQEVAQAVTKTEALDLLRTVDYEMSLRTLDRHIAAGDIRKVRYRNGRVKLVRSDVLALAVPVAEGRVS